MAVCWPLLILFLRTLTSFQNIGLFFCLYAHHWNDPQQCNSTHSRLLGFLSALPGIWRALQCLRRYRDTRNTFPHLVNCGKYIMTITYYATLSIYRIKRTTNMLALFTTFAAINAIYCCKFIEPTTLLLKLIENSYLGFADGLVVTPAARKQAIPT